MTKIGLLIELNASTLKPANLGMITAVKEKGHTLYALLLEPVTIEIKEQLAQFGVDHIVAIHMNDQNWNPDRGARAVTIALDFLDIHILLGLTTAEGKDLLPRIAAILDAPLVMDCIQVDIKRQVVKTSQYSEKTIATLRLTGDRQIYGVRPNVTTAIPNPVDTRTTELKVEVPLVTGLEVVKLLTEVSDCQNLSEAEVIIAGGRGMKNADNFGLLYDCAREIEGAAVGASRVAVDEGWVPYRMQVGQTGARVNPKVYLACGISGSVQHYAGMKTAGMIIAVNIDAEAAIMANCDYYIEADLFAIMPELIRQLKRASKV